MEHHLILFVSKKTLIKAQEDSINETLEDFGFTKIGKGLFLGKTGLSEAHATIAIQEVTLKNDWFNKSIKTLKILRVSNILDAKFITESTTYLPK